MPLASSGTLDVEVEDDLENVAVAVVDGLVNVVSTDVCAVVTYYSVRFVLVCRCKKHLKKIQNLRCKYRKSIFDVF